MPSDAAAPRPKRRWRRLLLIAAAGLLLAVLVAVLVGVDAYRRDLRRDSLATEIQRAGGYVEQPKPLRESIAIWWKSGRLPRRQTIAQLSEKTFNNQWIREHDYLRDFDFWVIHCDSIAGDDLAKLIDTHPLEVLNACDIVLTDEVLRAIRENPTLTLLALGESRYTDEQFAQLPLERLDHLSPNGVTAAGLMHARRCRALTSIALNNGSQLTAEVADMLGALGTVDSIHLFGPEMTDDHVRLLPRIKSLAAVHLIDASVTPAARASLAATMPGCQVEVATSTVAAESTK